MKSLILAVVAATTLGGCIVVPVSDHGRGGYYGRPRASVFVPVPFAYHGNYYHGR